MWSLKFLKEKKDVEAANVACSGGVPDQGSTDTGSSDYITTIATLGRDTLELCIGVSRLTRTVRVGRND